MSISFIRLFSSFFAIFSLRTNTFVAKIFPVTPGGTRKGRVHHVFRFFAENDLKQAFFGGGLLIALGRHFANQNVAGGHVGAHADDARFVQIGQGFRAHVGNVFGDFFGPHLRVTGFHLKFRNVDGGENVVPHQSLGQKNRVFEVVPFPGHEGHEQVAPQSQLAALGPRPIRQELRLF
jgi:hypothetical protein